VPAAALAGLLGVVAVAAGVAGVRDLLADRHARDALERSADGDTAGALAEADDARVLRGDQLRYDLLAAAAAAQPGTARGLAAGLDRIDDALAVSPHDPVVRLQRADLLARLAHLTRAPTDELAATTAWQDVLATDPRNPVAWSGLARTAIDGGDVETAESALGRAEWLSPHNPAPSTELAILYLDLGRTAEARAAAERAVAIDPTDAEARRALDLASRGS
jgi:predicted Zn-dependent protease